jgi:hypothetical protein
MRSHAQRGSPRSGRLSRILACAAAFAVSPAPAFAHDAPAIRAVGKSPGAAPGKAPARRGAPVPAQHYWFDGSERRELRIDPSQVADFGKEKGATARPLRPVRESEKSATGLPPRVSPVLTDAVSPSGPRALPGGVIVTLKLAPAGNDPAARDAQARRQLVEAGLEPLRAIDPEARRWLVASPAGLESLEQANRLHESGDFESAAPNWWQPRALK